MAGPNLTNHSTIISVKTQNTQGIPANITLPQDAHQTFKNGVPLMFTTPGYAGIWDDATILQGIIGITPGVGANLATAGAGAPPPFGTVGFPGAAVVDPIGVQFQPNAVVIPPGARATDGRVNIELGVPETWFEAQYDNSTGAVAADYETSASMVGNVFGLTVDANGYWYVDGAKTIEYPTADYNAVVRVVELNPIDGDGTVSGMLNGRVRFIFLNYAYALGN